MMESSELLEVNALAWELCKSQGVVLKALSLRDSLLFQSMIVAACSKK